jgi:translation initiation factor 3 subunit K
VDSQFPVINLSYCDQKISHLLPLRYQFNVDLYNTDVVINILLKGLAATPQPDFNLCMALLSERAPAATADDAEADGDDADGEGGSGGSSSHTSLLATLTQLSRLLNECRFSAFWALYRDDALAYLRENFTVEVVGFEDAIREVIVKAVRSTFTKIGVARLGSYLDLSGTRITFLFPWILSLKFKLFIRRRLGGLYH